MGQWKLKRYYHASYNALLASGQYGTREIKWEARKHQCRNTRGRSSCSHSYHKYYVSISRVLRVRYLFRDHDILSICMKAPWGHGTYYLALARVPCSELPRVCLNVLVDDSCGRTISSRAYINCTWVRFCDSHCPYLHVPLTRRLPTSLE